MGKYIRTLTILFDTELKKTEIPLFRGAILHALGEKANTLFHNHSEGNTFRYSYPLIQYKQLGGKAAIVCIEAGADIIGEFLTKADASLRIGDRQIECNTLKIYTSRILVQTWEEQFHYHLTRWLPLNSKNYLAYQSAESVIERMELLEGILKGNILSTLKGLSIFLEQELQLKITDIGDPYLVRNKGIKLMAFNADFICNLSIPNNIGLGKNASIGYGTVHQHKKTQS